MTRCYLDTSAAAKLLLEERESAALAEWLTDSENELVASYLLETELRRIVPRSGVLTQEAVSDVLQGVNLFEVPPSLFREAGLLAGASLRSLDALHLATAVRLGVDAVIAYDIRMVEAARAFGFAIVAPE